MYTSKDVVHLRGEMGRRTLPPPAPPKGSNTLGRVCGPLCRTHLPGSSQGKAGGGFSMRARSQDAGAVRGSGGAGPEGHLIREMSRSRWAPLNSGRSGPSAPCASQCCPAPVPHCPAPRPEPSPEATLLSPTRQRCEAPPRGCLLVAGAPGAPPSMPAVKRKKQQKQQKQKPVHSQAVGPGPRALASGSGVGPACVPAAWRLPVQFPRTWV